MEGGPATALSGALRRTCMFKLLVALAFLSLALGGCMTPSETPAPPPPAPAADQRVLPGAVAPAVALAPLAFQPAVSVAKGFVGEPSIIAVADGSLFLTFPGCPSGQTCNNGLMERSVDGGATWKVLNLENGSLDASGHDANFDAMVAVDAAGTLYASHLGGGLPTFASTDGGATWAYRGDPVPASDGADRQWLWGGPAGVIVQDWMATSPTRSAAVSVSRDGGTSWSTPFYADEPIGWIGPATGTPDGSTLLAPYTKPLTTGEDPTGLALMADPAVELRYLFSADGGAKWEVRSTGVQITKPPTGTWPGTLMAPVMATLGDGSFVYVWSEQVVQDAGPGKPAATVKAVSSADGATWSAPRILSGTRTGIMPWVVPLGGDRFAVAYYAADDVHASNDYEGTWDVELAVVDAQSITSGHVATGIHNGGVCAKGGVCGLTFSDRSLLDFLGGTLLPDGRVAIAFSASPGGPTSMTSGFFGFDDTEVRVAVETPVAAPAPQP